MDMMDLDPITNPASVASTSASPHLSYPSISEDADDLVGASIGVTPSQPQPRGVLKDRLYVGNLAPTVDEYTLLQVFSKYGKISKLDYLFHKAGPHKGRPRGYAFVQYANHDDASKALSSAHDKLLRGRKIVVTYAQQAPIDADGTIRHRKLVNDASKPTALSLMKSMKIGGRAGRTEDKIAKMEAKLHQLQAFEGVDSAASSSLIPAHPSLPTKPSAAVIRAADSRLGAGTSASTGARRPPSNVPVSLAAARKAAAATGKAVSQPTPSPAAASGSGSLPGSAGASPRILDLTPAGASRSKPPKGGLAGVRIGKGPVPGLKKG